MTSPPTWAGVSLCEAAFRREPLPQACRPAVRIVSGFSSSAECDLLERPDREIWDFARNGGFVIVSTDADFYELAAALGPPPKVVWLRRWTHPTRDAEFVLRRDAIRITEFAADPALGFLLLDRQ